MPITKELENINELEAAGFDHNQAKILTGILSNHTLTAMKASKSLSAMNWINRLKILTVSLAPSILSFIPLKPA